MAKPDNRVGDALKSIATIYEKQSANNAKQPPENRPCEAGKDDRKSDLCAQWKAADAAEKAAWWAAIAGWSGSFSFFGVLVALGLAFNSNSIARDTARKQLRAYLDFDGVRFLPFSAADDPSETRTGISVSIKNYGQTPASNLAAKRTFFVKIRDLDWVAIQQVIENDMFGSISPNDAGHFRSQFCLPNILVDALNDGGALFKVIVEAEYLDIFSVRQKLSCEFTNTNVPTDMFNFIAGTRVHT